MQREKDRLGVQGMRDRMINREVDKTPHLVIPQKSKEYIRMFKSLESLEKRKKKRKKKSPQKETPKRVVYKKKGGGSVVRNRPSIYRVDEPKRCMHRVNIYIPSEYMHLLDAAEKSLGLSRTRIIQLAVAEYCEGVLQGKIGQEKTRKYPDLKRTNVYLSWESVTILSKVRKKIKKISEAELIRRSIKNFLK